MLRYALTKLQYLRIEYKSAVSIVFPPGPILFLNIERAGEV